MNKGLELYKALIDKLVQMSRSCAAANSIIKGKVHGTEAETGINDVLFKLNEKEKTILAKYVLNTYHSGIYDTLEQLEWLRECKAMVITVDGEILPTGKYEGMPCDYIGHHENWEWPKD
ncbi:DUF6547 family protein [Lacrimispora sp.]|uniref:DUF6547 family protein n=1 Tax=Lacrimispora sp. TaxID=2719234 RepID=UPI002899CADC|nr:DUF6547 family protein [Lacrimispora sp.]